MNSEPAPCHPLNTSISHLPQLATRPPSKSSASGSQNKASTSPSGPAPRRTLSPGASFSLTSRAISPSPTSSSTPSQIPKPSSSACSKASMRKSKTPPTNPRARSPNKRHDQLARNSIVSPFLLSRLKHHSAKRCPKLRPACFTLSTSDSEQV
jgi:hypothetical protein